MPPSRRRAPGRPGAVSPWLPARSSDWRAKPLKPPEGFSTQIAAIQTSTIEAVDVIQSINAVTDDIAGFTAAVASSVEQQHSAAQMITRNVQGAAVGVTQLAGNMTQVTTAIGETNRFASEVLEVAHTLSAQTGTIDKAVEDFLKRVTAV